MSEWANEQTNERAIRRKYMYYLACYFSPFVFTSLSALLFHISCLICIMCVWLVITALDHFSNRLMFGWGALTHSLTHSLYRSGVHSEKEKEKERPGTCVWELWLINAYEKLRSSYLHKGANKAAYSAFCPINCYYRRLIFFSKLKWNERELAPWYGYRCVRKGNI